MDRLEELANLFNATLKTQNLIGVNYKGNSIKKLELKKYFPKKITIDEYDEVFVLIIKANSKFAFAVNKADRVCLINKPFNIKFSKHKIYSSGNGFGNSADFPRLWEKLCPLLDKLKLSSKESIIFYRNQISAALLPTRNFDEFILDVLNIIETCPFAFPADKRLIINTKKIPDELKHLVPLLKKWSYSHDVERGEQVSNASDKQKKQIIAFVMPAISTINQFLDSFADAPLTHEAILLGNLAELVSELSNGKI